MIKGALNNFRPYYEDRLIFHNGVVAMAFTAEFSSGEWTYIVRFSVDQNSILSIHEPSSPGRYWAMEMDDEQLIVNHQNYELNSFTDTFRFSDGNRSTIINIPDSNESLGFSILALDKNNGLMYSASGPPGLGITGALIKLLPCPPRSTIYLFRLLNTHSTMGLILEGSLL